MTHVLMILAIIVAVVLTAGMIIIICEMIVFAIVMSVYAIQDKIGERKEQHTTRFMWYYRTGLVESGCFLESKIAKNSILWNME